MAFEAGVGDALGCTEEYVSKSSATWAHWCGAERKGE